jgi:hypothetical protein
VLRSNSANGPLVTGGGPIDTGSLLFSLVCPHPASTTNAIAATKKNPARLCTPTSCHRGASREGMRSYE